MEDDGDHLPNAEYHFSMFKVPATTCQRRKTPDWKVAWRWRPWRKCGLAIRFGAKGKLFVSAGDDKIVKIWSAKSWRCICTVSSGKRVCAVAISNDGSYVCFADKFGVVWVVDLTNYDDNQPLVDKKPTPLLSHYCSIITSLEFSPDGHLIVNVDWDFKIRVIVFPNHPLSGAHH